jgi:PAS domain-containing protein
MLDMRLPLSGGDCVHGNSLYSSAIEHAVFGFALHRILTDGIVNPADYEYLVVNEAFKRMTGLERTAVIGRKASELIPCNVADSQDWVGSCGAVALGGPEIEFERYFAPPGRYASFCPRSSASSRPSAT